MGKKNIHDSIIQKHFEANTDEGDSKIISGWLDKASRNKHVFTTLKKVFIEQEGSKRKYKTLTEEAYSKFSDRLLKRETVQHAELKLNHSKFRRQLLRYVAGAALFILIGAGSFYAARSMYSTDTNSEFVIEVPYGGRSKIILPDGSSVWLNAGSKLTYNSQFSSRSRSVTLEGEAFFDVQKSSNPFIVHTSHLNIHVLGTSFNVKSYPDEDKIETTLVEGEIRIERPELTKPLLLKPNEKMTFHKVMGETEISSKVQEQGSLVEENEPMLPKKRFEISKIEIFEGVNTEESTSWKEGDLIFNKEPLMHLTRMLERKYDIEFEFESEELKAYSYSGTLRDFPLEQVLRALELTSPIKYSINGKKVRLEISSKSKYQ